MKDLYIPKNDIEDSIHISYINNCFNGLIIPYKNNTPVGYIVWYDGDWYLYGSTMIESDPMKYINGKCYMNESLIHLCDEMLKDKTATNFKVIEFE